MSFHCFFALSTGLRKTIHVPKGTKRSWLDHVEEVEKTLGLQRTQYENNPIYWDRFKRDFSKIPDEVLCETVRKHNDWVRGCWDRLAFWSKHPFTVGKGYQDEALNRAYPAGWKAEKLTPKDAQEFWHGFEILEVPPARWTREYYVNRMEHLYSVMRGNESEGVTFEVKALTPKQAAAVIRIFDQYLDAHDMRLDVPRGHDYLASSYDGGYEWCEKCGCAVHPDDVGGCRRRKCPLQEEDEE